MASHEQFAATLERSQELDATSVKGLSYVGYGKVTQDRLAVAHRG
jgi:hypothetical protein